MLMILSNTQMVSHFKNAARCIKLARLALVTLLLVLASACSQLPNLMGNNGAPQKTDSLTESAPNDVTTDDTEGNDPLAVDALPQLTPQELKIQALSARPNMYALSKRTLSPQTKQEVLAALNTYKSGDLAQSQKQINDVLNNRLDANSAVYVLAGDIAMAQANDLGASPANQQTENTQEEDEAAQYTASAQKHFEKALALNPDNAKAANRLAKLLREQGEFTEAEALYSQAIAAQPMHASSYRNRAVLRDLYMNKKAMALQDYQDYAALLNHQQKQSEQGSLVLSEPSQKALAKDIKLVRRWLVDVERQVNALAKAQAANNANAGGGE
jgi:tetratricopeptide (TPR) repeat protein